MTHYIPFFAQPNPRARTHQAVCGTHVPPKEHTNEPTCHACLAWLEQDAETAAIISAGLGLELRDGLLVSVEK